MSIIDNTAQMLASQVRVQIDAYTLKVFKIPMWLVRNKFMFRLYSRVFDCKIEIQGGGLIQVYKFYKLGEKVGELHIAQTIIRSEVEGGNPILNIVYKAWDEFWGNEAFTETEPLTGWPVLKPNMKQDMWKDFEVVLKKYLK
jgi:hypothetical protein